MAASVARKSIAPSPGNQVPVHARGGDVLEMVMPRVRGHLARPSPADPRRRNRRGRCRSSIPPKANRSARRTPGTARTARSSSPGSGSISRPTSSCLGNFDAGHQLVVKDLGGRRPTIGRARAARPARSAGSARRSPWPAERPLGVLAADRPIVRVGLDPRRMPVRLPRVGHGVHHEAVDVRDLPAMLGQRLADRLLCVRATARPARRAARRPALPCPSSRSRRSARSSPRSRSSCTRWS